MQLSYWELKIGLQGRLHRCGEWNVGLHAALRCAKNTESKILVLEKECYHMRALRMLVLPALEVFLKLLMT
jgi:hypothetical protein